MTDYRRGAVVLVPFPFADRLALKRRPAVIVSSDGYNAAGQEVIIAQITSRVASSPRPGDHRIQGWRGAGLLAPSLARARLATLNSSHVLRRLGVIPEDDMRAIDGALREVIGLG